MKRLCMILLSAALLCAFALHAAADVAYMPRDSFLEKHWEDCRHVNRWYYANGPEGYVLAHKTPDSAEATPLPNGGKYYVSNVYKGEWGVLEYEKDTLENSFQNGSASGWVRMSEMVAEYDSDSFFADHAAELRDESAELVWSEPDTVFSYKYPGSGVVLAGLMSGEITFNTLFTDPAGRRWGYCGYYYGHRDFWVCLDDPYNDALPPDENCVTVSVRAPAQPTQTPEPTEAPADDGNPTPAPAGKTVELTPPADSATLQQAAKENRGAGPYVAAGAGGVVVIAAAVLAAALKKKKNKP